MLDVFITAEGLVALLTLTALEIVLGIDNVIFIAILSGKLPEKQQKRARRLGLLGAMVQRILLLLAIGWIIGLSAPLFSLLGNEISGRDLILIAGGVFLLAKSTIEIHEKLEGHRDERRVARPVASFASVIGQIMVLDAVFSIDSVLTAVGLTEHVPIMIVAVVISVIIMMIFAEWISAFVARHPTIKMLALAILFTIGVLLVAEGFDAHVPRGYLYFAMAFSLAVELLNIRAGRGKRPPEMSHEQPQRT